MPGLIVIRITPKTPVTPSDFADYLSPPGLGPLSIAAYDLSFNDPVAGEPVGTAAFIAPISSASPTVPVNSPFVTLTAPQYASGTGIAQQVDLQPFTGFGSTYESPYFAPVSVATAIIAVPDTLTFENLRLVAQWGSGATAVPVPITLNYYDTALAPGGVPDINGWAPNAADPVAQLDPWASFAPTLYLQLPRPPATSSLLTFQMPTDGTPPAFVLLLTAVRTVVNADPGTGVTLSTVTSAAADAVTLGFASIAGVSVGMTATGTGLAAGTTVAAVDATDITVGLDQQLADTAPAGTSIAFAPNLATLTFEQCRNIAYEIIWSQQPPLPAPPDAVENLYTNPPNSGQILSAGSSSQANLYEGERQQFEANLQSYYAVADTNATRLTNFVYALSAAIACEQHSIAAQQAVLDFPVNPLAGTAAVVSETSVVVTGVANVGAAGNFGVPAAFFYALAATLPTQVTTGQRYQMATGSQLPRLLTDLTTGIDAGTITDSEAFVVLPAASATAAQAARRLVALGVPQGTATPLAPLGCVRLALTADVPAGRDLPVTASGAVIPGMLAVGANIALGTAVTSVNATGTNVELNQPLLNAGAAGSAVIFVPPYAGDLQGLIAGWLAYPPPVQGAPSSQPYQPVDDAGKFWPHAASAHATAFLGLVLSSLTQDYIIPAPFNVALGQKIIDFLATLASPPTVATLAAVTDEQWTALFTQNPTWLPPFTQPGNTAARIAAFIRYAQSFFTVNTGGPPSQIDFATTTQTLAGATSLVFAPTSAILQGMSVSAVGIAPGTAVAATPVTTATATTVGLSRPTLAGLPVGTNVTFAPDIVGLSAGALPRLPMPSSDWLGACLSAYGPYTLGDGLDADGLAAAAATVFPDDASVQAWLVEALTTLDALYAVMKTVTLSPATTPELVFSVVEALYARGFRSAADITMLDGASFQQALLGTIAYPAAAAIYSSANAIAPHAPATPPSGPFKPINADGLLTNCMPPPCTSPLGPVAYLHDLLQLTELSTCAQPATQTITLKTNGAAQTGATTLSFATTGGVFAGMQAIAAGLPDGTTVSAVTANTVAISQAATATLPAGTSGVFRAPSLGAVVGKRRGPIGDLLASCANLETPLPLIDIVNECLEYLGAAASLSAGTVYDTASETLAGLPLCMEQPPAGPPSCHDADRLFAAIPEYSTPGTPETANAAVEPAVFNKLKNDFSACCLPYSQALDVARTYLDYFRTCRFETMRTFRKCITEFVLDPVTEPGGFQSHLWRYPVRVDIAIDYLGITPEEYSTLFQGTAVPSCAAPSQQQPPANSPVPGGLPAIVASRESVHFGLPAFLELTCLDYCEFYELWKSGFVAFGNGADAETLAFPECEPCCLDDYGLQFGDGEVQTSLPKLVIFVRLWRKLRESRCFCYTFAELRDICDVLHLFNGSAINPDFIRQFAALQMLRDHFQLPLSDPADTPAAILTGADRTHLLALWVGPTAAKWWWACQQLVDRIEHHACRFHGRERRASEFVKALSDNLDRLSALGGFDAASTTDTWHAVPTHTLRFAEILDKIYASNFTIGEIVYLFTASDQLKGDDPFPLQDQNEALDLPLGLPADDDRHSLWHLRHALVAAAERPPEGDAAEPGWHEIDAVLQADFGFNAADILALGEHFFPRLLERSGHAADAAAARFTSPLPTADTSAAMWNVPADGPFQYAPTSELLSVSLPLTDDSVFAKLTYVHALNAAERQAVQDLFFQPRAMLARFGLLFSDFATAERHLIEANDEVERWAYFRHAVGQARGRLDIIAEHLAHHVAAVTGQPLPEGKASALLILRSLFADENAATAPWENDAGTTPPVTWGPQSVGGAVAALLGLAGSGLIAEYKPAGGTMAWRDGPGGPAGFGHARDRANCPVPTVLPALDTTISPQQMQFVTAHNGFLMKDATGAWLGGAQGFETRWHGALLIEDDGTYEFWAGAPTPDHDKPDREAALLGRWRVELKRAQRSWTILSHHWAGEEERPFSALPLRRGAYELTAEFVQPSPDFASDEQATPVHTGFQVKYSGPDSDNLRVELPYARLFPAAKHHALGDGIAGLSAGASAYLSTRYVSSLRDIRRSYQRAFKALLFAHRFALSAERRGQGRSELGYMLAQKANFAGTSYYRAGGGFVPHRADFDFNLLPLKDNYFAPVADMRTAPTVQRSQALFDWWERVFDYAAARREVRRRCDRHLWHLFDEAEEQAAAHPAYLLRHLGADSRHWHLALRYFQGQAAPVYAISSTDFEDDRWVLRAWHADRWLSLLTARFAAKDITVARPDLWASDDPSAVVAGESETGNANLTSFLNHGCLDNCEPRRYEDVKRLNDGLRERGRDALVAYLCHGNRVALPWLTGAFASVARDLSDLLLIDVEAGIRERASRIDEAASAIQAFTRRARLGLEPGWVVTPEFARLWDREFANFRVWQECKRRHLYKENWVEWDELESARKVEAFRFLEDRLRDATLTVAQPGGLEWWPDQRPPHHRGLEALQEREASSFALIPTQHEGLDLLGVPERAGQPSWLTFVRTLAVGNGGNSPPSVAAAAPRSIGTLPSRSPALPYWIEAAMKLGKRFYRIAAAGSPPAVSGFAPHPREHEAGCVTCCAECGCDHPTLVDEYYFWLVDGAVYQPPETPVPTGYTVVPSDAETEYVEGYQRDFYDPSQQEAALWQDITQLPKLLYWHTVPMVRLAWCRVHNGEFQQPRQSALGVAITPGADADLAFLGRHANSLNFSVSNAEAPEGYSDPSPAGFRFDMARDEAVPLPLVAPPDPSPVFPAALPAYPYFLYDTPGAQLFPLTPFSPALAVARALRARCRFEAALKWYRLAFDPLRLDCTWIECAPERVPGQAPERQNNPAHSVCCDATDITCEQARDRAVVLDYLETLVEWGGAVRRRHNSREGFEQARVVFEAASLILGKPPREIRAPEPIAPTTVANFVPAFAPLNPRLLDLYETVKDRLALIRADIGAPRLTNGRFGRGIAYFGDDPVGHGWRSNFDACAEEDGWCLLPSPYRFSFLIQKAQDYAARAEQLGNALLSAFEKGDAEYLESLRADHERELLTLGLEARKDQWRDADWQIGGLQTSKAASQANLIYYNGLINAGPNGLIDGEIQYQNLTQSALSLRGTANLTEGVGEAMRLIPDLVLGVAGFASTPVSINWIPLGTKVGEALEAVARIVNNSAEIDGIAAQLDETNASWDRRLADWIHQTQILAIEIHQTERQILGAQRRRDEALQNLNQYRRQIEQSAAVLNFLRDRFTARDLYLFLQKETAALYYQTVELAQHAARQAQRAFNIERGDTVRHFLPSCGWDNLHEGLLAGERLSAALRHMEKAYLDENVREYELTKHFSLRLHFPFEFLRLRTTGRCEIEIPEWMFDLDFPGQYMRRIKSIALTIPCVTGPFTGIHCRLTLLDSVTRIDPRLKAPAHECCCPPEACDCAEAERAAREYALCPDDPRAARHRGACEAIATSSGQNDPGLFELSFSDPRYLPFEFKGAVSRWRIEMPPENNYFDLDTLTDTIVRLNYTAREGGDLLRRAAGDSAHRRLPGDGWHFFDVRHEFPDAWQLVLDTGRKPSLAHWLRLRLERRHFAFIPGGREIWLDKFAILFGGLEREPVWPRRPDCPCPEPRILAHRDVAFVHDRLPQNEKNVRCFAGRSWPDLYCGMVDADLGPLGPRGGPTEIGFRFPRGQRLERIFLLCRYTLGERCDRREFADGYTPNHHHPHRGA